MESSIELDVQRHYNSIAGDDETAPLVTENTATNQKGSLRTAGSFASRNWKSLFAITLVLALVGIVSTTLSKKRSYASSSEEVTISKKISVDDFSSAFLSGLKFAVVKDGSLTTRDLVSAKAWVDDDGVVNYAELQWNFESFDESSATNSKWRVEFDISPSGSMSLAVCATQDSMWDGTKSTVNTLQLGIPCPFDVVTIGDASDWTEYDGFDLSSDDWYKIKSQVESGYSVRMLDFFNDSWRSWNKIVGSKTSDNEIRVIYSQVTADDAGYLETLKSLVLILGEDNQVSTMWSERKTLTTDDGLSTISIHTIEDCSSTQLKLFVGLD